MRREEDGSGAPGRYFLVVFNKQPLGKERREDPELSGEVSLLSLLKNDEEKAGGKIRSSRERCLTEVLFVLAPIDWFSEGFHGLLTSNYLCA